MTISNYYQLDNCLNAWMCGLSDPAWPVCEIGVASGDSACFLYEKTFDQKRKLILVDSYDYLDSIEKRKWFVQNVVYEKFTKSPIDNVEFFIQTYESMNWSQIVPSFYHLDATFDKQHVLTWIQNSPPNTIFSFDGFGSWVPHMTEFVVEFIKAGILFPIAFGYLKIWATPNKDFHLNIVQNFANSEFYQKYQNQIIWNLAEFYQNKALNIKMPYKNVIIGKKYNQMLDSLKENSNGI